MPPPTPNIGQLIGSTNTGYAANVSNSYLGPHSPATLSTHTGDFNTTATGQVVENLNITGKIQVRHDNVTFRNCKARSARDDTGQKLIRKKPQFFWCTIGVETGPSNSDNVGCVYLADFLFYRCQIFGWIDLVHVLGGAPTLVENWIHSPYYNPNRGSNHMDPIQPPGESPGSSHNGFSSFLCQGNRFDTWPYTGSQTAGSQFGNLGIKASTSGAFNIEWGICKEFVFRDNYVDGNYSQCMYALNNPAQGGMPGPIIVIDNIFKKRRSPNYGSSSFMNGHQTRVTWGRNLDADSGAPIPLFYQGTSFNGIKVDAGPSSQYKTFYAGPPPPPPPPPPSDDPPFRALSTATSGAGTTANLVFNKPTGTTTGDVMVWAVTLNDTTGTFPAGWTSLPGTPLVTTHGTPTRKMYVAYKVATGAEPSTYTFTMAASKECSGILASYLGMDGDTPINASAVAASTASGTTVATSLTTTANDCRVVTFLGADATNTTAPDSFSINSSATKRSEVFDTSTYMTTALFDENQASPALVSRTGTIENTAVSRMIAMIALRKAGTPEPQAAVEVTSPANASTHTTGVVTLLGTADTDVGDSVSNYDAFNYYIEGVGDGTLAKTLVERDVAGSNNGVSFTASSSGVAFTDRNGVAYSEPAGDYILTVEGERKDGTRPAASVTVTFGIDDPPPPPPTDIQFAPIVTATMRGVIDIDTTTGGVAEPIERVSRKIPVQYRVEWYWRGTQTLREVEFVGGTPVYKGQS